MIRHGATEITILYIEAQSPFVLSPSALSPYDLGPICAFHCRHGKKQVKRNPLAFSCGFAEKADRRLC
jgi:hypothetical protein